MSTTAQAGMSSSVHVHEIYIRAEASAIWEALTTPEWAEKYGYRAGVEYDLRPGGRFRGIANAGMRSMGLPETIIDGEVIEADPPHKLVQTYRFLFTEEQRKEGFTRITWEIVPTGKGFCRLTVTHDSSASPSMTVSTTTPYNDRGGGGWNFVLSDLKSLLETGKAMS
jgi:uncharacterized protein YndB with AHSA1/START domain